MIRNMMRRTIALFAVFMICLLGAESVHAAQESLSDGKYEIDVSLEGGSGRVTIQSPAELTVSDGIITAKIIWSSNNYTYMQVGDKKYEPEKNQETSTFDVEIDNLKDKLEFEAETTAMSEPHTIDYSIVFDKASLQKKSQNSGYFTRFFFMLGAMIIVGTIAFMRKKHSKHTQNSSTHTLKLFICMAAGASLLSASLTGCARTASANATSAVIGESVNSATTTTDTISTAAKFNMNPGNGWTAKSDMVPEYAKNFRISYFDGGYKLIALADGSRFMTVPDGKTVPEGIDEDITVIRQPLQNVYLAASASMCLFDAIDSIDSIGFSGTQEKDWYIENAQKAMENGNIVYAGKYSEPDYEMILSGKCPLAIESTMILHAPEVKEKLEELGIPVLIDQSSSEDHPLGRTEWIKVYGALTDKDDEAQAVFEQQSAYLDKLDDIENTGKTVAFFYINSNGSAVTRKSGDYVAKMIELAGGNYVLDDNGSGDKKSTITMEMEQFYSKASDADFIIYNGTIDDAPSSLAELTAKYPLLKEFKAVKDGNVWCTDKNMYQDSTGFGLMISDIHEILTGSADNELDYLYRLQ